MSGAVFVMVLHPIDVAMLSLVIWMKGETYLLETTRLYLKGRNPT